MSRPTKAALAALLFLLAGVFLAGAARAQYSDYGDPSDDWGYSDPDIRQTVARLAYVSGDVAFARGDDPDTWQPADPNVPMTLGDRIWTSGGRLELQVHGGSYIRLAKSTDLIALNLTEDTKQFSLSAGVASFRVPRLGDDEVYEVDTPNAAVTFERNGDYRIDVRPNGDTRVQVRQGRAIVASAGGQVPLGSGSAMIIEGSEPPRYDMVGMPRPDGWDGWVSDRDARYANVRSYQYVSPDIAGVADLDYYGRWQQVPNYGWCWTPTRVAVGWQPYRVGRWIWQDPWGWTWVSTEPWGWAPYHYGRWVTVSSSWYWVPVAPRVAVVSYSPALVAFVGGGPGFSVSVGVGTTDYIGWFPLAPRDPLIPWWGRPPTTVVNVTNVTYVNRTYVTVVNQNTFVQSRVVNTNYVKDRSVIQTIERAPVVRGSVPILPTRESIRVTTRQATAVRPPAAVAQRAVVTRVAPPPAPPRFDTKVATIREQKRPVTTVEAERIVQRQGRVAPAKTVRPAAEQGGRVALQPKTANSTQPRVEPIAPPSRGRQLATQEQPVAPLSERPAQQRGRTAPERPQSVDPQAQPQPPGDDAARERTRQEQSNQDQVDRMNAQREQAQREQAQKEQSERQQAQREQAARQQAQREQAQREQAQREQAQREQAQKEQSERQQAQREQAARQQAQREQAQREQAQREQAQREQAQRNREQAQRQQQQQQEEARKDQPQRAPRPTARPAQDEQPDRGAARPPAERSQQPPPQARSQQDREKDQPAETRTPPQRGRKPTPKPTPKGDSDN